MRKIILTEFYPLKGHANLFSNTYRLLRNHYDVTAIITKDNELHDESCITIPFSYYKDTKWLYLNRLLLLLYSFRVFYAIIKEAKRVGVNEIVCLTYDEVSLFFCSFFLPRGKNVFLMHHVNIDNITKSKIKRWMFEKYKNKYSHIVQCGFIADYMVSNFDIKNVLVWPHPLNRVNQENVKRDIDCVGISNSNDEHLINDLIIAETTKEIFKKNGLFVVLKSKKQKFDNGYLKIINGFLPNDVYNDYIARAKSIFLPFPAQFNMRMSGTLIDGLTNRKPLIATSIPLIRESSKCYPHIIKVYNRDTIITILQSFNLKGTLEKEFDEFRNFHSDENLMKIMFSSLDSAIEHRTIDNIFDF